MHKLLSHYDVINAKIAQNGHFGSFGMFFGFVFKLNLKVIIVGPKFDDLVKSIEKSF